MPPVCGGGGGIVFLRSRISTNIYSASRWPPPILWTFSACAYQTITDLASEFYSELFLLKSGVGYFLRTKEWLVAPKALIFEDGWAPKKAEVFTIGLL